MIQKAEIVVEQFAQGITVRCKNGDNKSYTSKALAINGAECGIIGKEIWKDISEILCDEATDRIRIKIEYEALISTV